MVDTDAVRARKFTATPAIEGIEITLFPAAAATIRVKDQVKCRFDIVARKPG